MVWHSPQLGLQPQTRKTSCFSVYSQCSLPLLPGKVMGFLPLLGIKSTPISSGNKDAGFISSAIFVKLQFFPTELEVGRRREGMVQSQAGRPQTHWFYQNSSTFWRINTSQFGNSFGQFSGSWNVCFVYFCIVLYVGVFLVEINCKPLYFIIIRNPLTYFCIVWFSNFDQNFFRLTYMFTNFFIHHSFLFGPMFFS